MLFDQEDCVVAENCCTSHCMHGIYHAAAANARWRQVSGLESSAAADSNAAVVELLATGLELKSFEINRGLALRDGPEVAGDR